MCFTGNDGYQNFLVFAPMLISLILDCHRKVVKWTSTKISYEQIKPFDTSLQPTMSNLANGRVNFEFSKSALVQKSFFSSLYSNFILNLYIFYELNTWPRNPANKFSLKKYLFCTVKLARNTIKSKFTYNGRGIAFDEEGSLSFGNDFARNVVIFGVDSKSTSHTDN